MAIPTQNMRTVTVATTILSLALTILAIGEDETAIALLYDTVGAGLHIFGLYSISKRYFWGIAALAGYLATRFIVYAVLVVVYVLPGAQASQRDLCHSLEPPGEPDLSCDQGLSTGFYVFQSILLLCMVRLVYTAGGVCDCLAVHVSILETRG